MAGSLNRAMIIGNLTRDPELRQTGGGQNVCSFSVATNHSWKDASGQLKEQVEYHNIVAWGRLAEICSQYLAKGRKVYIDGRIQTREWEGQDGAKRKTTEIITENMVMLDRGGSPVAGTPTSNRSFSPSSAPAPMMEPVMSQEQEIKLEDIPF